MLPPAWEEAPRARTAMTTVNYPQPVQVNGFSCNNCTDVDYANKHIDPQHPNDGPYGINKLPKPGDPKPGEPKGAGGSSGGVSSVNGPAVVFGGRLAGLATSAGSSPASTAPRGGALDIFV
jgi:hypothetical protein